jgi:hypothetical protein
MNAINPQTKLARRQFLGPGEKATAMIVAADRKQARAALRFVRGLLAAPPFRSLIWYRDLLPLPKMPIKANLGLMRLG